MALGFPKKVISGNSVPQTAQERNHRTVATFIETQRMMDEQESSSRTAASVPKLVNFLHNREVVGHRKVNRVNKLVALRN